MKNVQALAAAVLTLSAFGAYAADAVVTTTSTTKKEATPVATPEVKAPVAKKHTVHTQSKVVADTGKTDTAVTTSTTATVK